MISHKFLMGRGRDQLSIEEIRMIESKIANVIEVPAREPLACRGEEVVKSTLLLEGFACRYKNDQTGARQAVELHVPGDFVDLHALPLKQIDHDIVTISEVKFATFDRQDLTDITQKSPRLANAFWFSTLLDAAIHRKWIFSHGRHRAEARIANFLCEIYVRLDMVGLVTDNAFHFPLTQPDIGEVTGLTGVHVNRVLRWLRNRGLFVVDKRRIQILDYDGLAKLGEFDPDYLFPSFARPEHAP